MRQHRRFSLLMVIFILIYTSSIQASGLTAAQIQSAYIFQIGKFVTWPESRMQGEQFNVCYLPPDDLSGMLNLMRGRRIFQKDVTIVPLKNLEAASICHVLYIGEHPQISIRQLIAIAQEHHILTVSPLGNSLTHSMLALPLVDNKVELQVNLNLLNSADLHMSTNLLEIASRVIKGDTP